MVETNKEQLDHFYRSEATQRYYHGLTRANKFRFALTELLAGPYVNFIGEEIADKVLKGEILIRDKSRVVQRYVESGVFEREELTAAVDRALYYGELDVETL